MKRQLYTQLIEWKNSKRRKPLLLQGARQVGKTWLINHFGQNEYKNFIYLNFEQNPNLKTLFIGSLVPSQIIENIALYLGEKISDKDTLICFDEIQVAPEAITSLKYFYEQAPEYHIVAAGSLLGVQIGKHNSFPVGKVNFMTLYPMSFSEFLEAIGEELLVSRIEQYNPFDAFPELLHEKLSNLFKKYLFMGGMPEVVQVYFDSKDILEVRAVQNEILEAYKRDFSKYSDTSQSIKTAEVWQSIPFQLARENKKFKYSEVRKKARASTFEQTIEWLRSAGLIHIVNNLRAPKLPLSGYSDLSKFKLYLMDSGLLGAMLNLSSDRIVNPTALFTEYNGAFIENYVCTELITSQNTQLFYWTSRGEAEVDFVFNYKDKIYPLEVKSGTNLNTKSIRSYAGKYNPDWVLRASPRNFSIRNDFVNVPLYASFAISNYLERLMKK